MFRMDAGLTYGLTEYARMIELIEIRGFGRAHGSPHWQTD
jgi:hypothetical protein